MIFTVKQTCHGCDGCAAGIDYHILFLLEWQLCIFHHIKCRIYYQQLQYNLLAKRAFGGKKKATQYFVFFSIHIYLPMLCSYLIVSKLPQAFKEPVFWLFVVICRHNTLKALLVPGITFITSNNNIIMQNHGAHYFMIIITIKDIIAFRRICFKDPLLHW